MVNGASSSTAFFFFLNKRIPLRQTHTHTQSRNARAFPRSIPFQGLHFLFPGELEQRGGTWAVVDWFCCLSFLLWFSHRGLSRRLWMYQSHDEPMAGNYSLSLLSTYLPRVVQILLLALFSHLNLTTPGRGRYCTLLLSLFCWSSVSWPKLHSLWGAAAGI